MLTVFGKKLATWAEHDLGSTGWRLAIVGWSEPTAIY